MSGIVTLVSQDQQKIEVELNVIRQSKVKLQIKELIMFDFRLFLGCCRI